MWVQHLHLLNIPSVCQSGTAAHDAPGQKSPQRPTATPLTPLAVGQNLAVAVGADDLAPPAWARPALPRPPAVRARPLYQLFDARGQYAPPPARDSIPVGVPAQLKLRASPEPRKMLGAGVPGIP